MKERIIVTAVMSGFTLATCAISNLIVNHLENVKKAAAAEEQAVQPVQAEVVQAEPVQQVQNPQPQPQVAPQQVVQQPVYAAPYNGQQVAPATM